MAHPSGEVDSLPSVLDEIFLQIQEIVELHLYLCRVPVIESNFVHLRCFRLFQPGPVSVIATWRQDLLPSNLDKLGMHASLVLRILGDEAMVLQRSDSLEMPTFSTKGCRLKAPKLLLNSSNRDVWLLKKLFEGEEIGVMILEIEL